MPNILDTIMAAKRQEVADRERRISVAALMDQPSYQLPRRSLANALRTSTDFGIIAEFKRKSPSQSDINLGADPVAVAKGYQSAGVAAMSVLTDQDFFGAQDTDFGMVRNTVDFPMIRKDFILDPYQLHEAKAMGADAILLIAAALSTDEILALSTTAKTIGLEVLCELHAMEELDKLCPAIDVVGVNNRNLKDFSVSIAQSLEMARHIPDQFLKISESGIEDPRRIVQLTQAGFSGFLIGTYFMRHTDPGKACNSFIQEVHQIAQDYKDATA